jgi:hypothetical protein
LAVNRRGAQEPLHQGEDAVVLLRSSTILLMMPSIAAATIVDRHNGDIWAMNDDGSGAHALVVIERSDAHLKIRGKAPKVCLYFDPHSCTHQEGWRDWPNETPATSQQWERCQFHQAPTTSLGDVDRRFH